MSTLPLPPPTTESALSLCHQATACQCFYSPHLSLGVLRHDAMPSPRSAFFTHQRAWAASVLHAVSATARQQSSRAAPVPFPPASHHQEIDRLLLYAHVHAWCSQRKQALCSNSRQWRWHASRKTRSAVRGLCMSRLQFVAVIAAGASCKRLKSRAHSVPCAATRVASLKRTAQELML